jgi:hypothetical protein
MHELWCRGITHRTAKPQIIIQAPIRQAAWAEDDNRLVLDHERRSCQRRTLYAQPVTELERLCHHSGESADANQNALNAYRRRLALSERFTGHFYQPLGDGKFVHLEWLETKQYTRAGPSSPLLATLGNRNRWLLGSLYYCNVQRPQSPEAAV